jgi:hypothetical protein
VCIDAVNSCVVPIAHMQDRCRRVRWAETHTLPLPHQTGRPPATACMVIVKVMSLHPLDDRFLLYWCSWRGGRCPFVHDRSIWSRQGRRGTKPGNVSNARFDTALCARTALIAHAPSMPNEQRTHSTMPLEDYMPWAFMQKCNSFIDSWSRAANMKCCFRLSARMTCSV